MSATRCSTAAGRVPPGGEIVDDRADVALGADAQVGRHPVIRIFGRDLRRRLPLAVDEGVEIVARLDRAVEIGRRDPPAGEGHLRRVLLGGGGGCCRGGGLGHRGTWDGKRQRRRRGQQDCKPARHINLPHENICSRSFPSAGCRKRAYPRLRKGLGPGGDSPTPCRKKSVRNRTTWTTWTRRRRFSRQSGRSGRDSAHSFQAAAGTSFGVRSPPTANPAANAPPALGGPDEKRLQLYLSNKREHVKNIQCLC